MAGATGNILGTFGTFIQSRQNPCVSVLNNVEYTASVEQVAFVLPYPPAGTPLVFRNGVRLPAAAVSVVGTALTYLPAGNWGIALQGGDIITVDYMRLDCTGIANGMVSVCEALSGVDEGGSVG